MSGEETILARRQRLSQVPRACEGCKVRKIRCDRCHPCGHCRASGITCQQQANPAPDPRPKADRVTQLGQYVATLEARLAKVEHRLGDTDSVSAPLREPSSSISPAASTEPVLPDVGPSDMGGFYEGSSSFINQSVQASEVAQRTAASETPEAAQTIGESFSHLKSLLSPGADLHDQQSSTDAPTQLVAGISPLPISLVIAILRRIKSRPSMVIAGHALIDVPLIEHMCQRVYFPTEPVSIGHVTSVNGILHLLLREYDTTQQPLGKGWDTKQLVAQAGRNFDIGVQSFNVLTVPSFENVLALAIAIIKYQSEPKPVLCRALLASACSHCQMLGYHREATYQRDRSGWAEIKRRLFWILYVHDRNASLLLGHASKMQEFEIDAHHPTPSPDPAQRPWDDLFCLIIRVSKIQGFIYDRLYSASALQSPAAERKRCVDALAADMNRWKHDFDQWDGSGVHFTSILELTKMHCNIKYYFTLTCLLRAPAMPGAGADMSSQCFQAARLSLQSHLVCFSTYDGTEWLSKSEYVNWALHYSSFTPFVVIFLHSIAASSLQDVQLLDEVVAMLRSAQNNHASTEKLYQICVAFARLARRMVEARSTNVGMYDQNTDHLQLPGVSEAVPWSWLEASPQPPGQQMEPGGFSDFLDDDMSLILADWINGQPPVTETFGMDFDK